MTDPSSSRIRSKAAPGQNLQRRIRIIGIGSAHGADGVGWLACERLQPSLNTHQLDWQLCRTPAQLPQLVQDCEAVVIIDALLSDAPAGRVVSLTWPMRLEHYAPGYSTHGINVIEALQLAETLDLLPAQTYLLGLTIIDPEHEAMPVVDDVIYQLQHELNHIVNRLTQPDHVICKVSIARTRQV